MKPLFFLLLFLLTINLVSAVKIGNSSITGVIVNAPPNAIISTFLGLSDTPNSYSGEAGNCVKVNGGETALEFGSCAIGGAGGNPFDQSLNTTDNVQFNNVTITGWFKGLFNLTTINNWLSFTGSVLSFNETKLNATIDSKLATTTYLPTLIVNVSGITTYGDLGNVTSMNDGFNYTVREATGTNALEIRINFTNVEDFNFGITRVWYNGGAGHYLDICLWNYNTADWDCAWTIFISTGFNIVTGTVFGSENYIGTGGDAGVVQVKFDHVGNGNTGHYLYIDYIAISDGISTITSNEHDALSGRNNILINHPNIASIFYNQTQIQSWNESWISTYNTTYNSYGSLFIRKDGTTTTTNLIPFVNGISVDSITEYSLGNGIGFNNDINAPTITGDNINSNVNITATKKVCDESGCILNLSQKYFYKEGYTINLNETKLNDVFVNQTGDNMTGNLNMQNGANITFNGIFKIYYNGSDLIIE